jgi:F-type H+-transporting ATPase subunit gamma
MTERLSDINDRITGIRQLGAVVNAMRGIAAARAQQARGQLAAVDNYAASIGAAIAQALALIPQTTEATSASGKPAGLGLVLFCAEQGFAGAFSERVLHAAGADLNAAKLFLIGTRGRAAMMERDLVPGWFASMPSHSAGIPKLGDQVARALYTSIATGQIDRLDAIYTSWQPGRGTHIERTHLFPFDPAAFPKPHTRNAPLLNLPAEKVLRSLMEDYMFAALCEAALHAFAAENEARMEAMAAARNQIERQLSGLRATQRLVRQEEITAEIIELAAGEAAALHRM